ncbi:hypothetical protein C0992_003277 [Termitomyces sp. T32_za158]|nr:hypothetical protein C0992_003277 [Termitomyces sp. T32_za158]
MGPIHGLQPSGTTWVNDFPHTAWQELSAYYIHAFKTGSYPTITVDVVYFWARPHPASAHASKDSLGRPQGWNWVSDTLWAAAFLTAPSTVTLIAGSSSRVFRNVPAGVTRLSIPLAPGIISVKAERDGKTVASETAKGYKYKARFNPQAHLQARAPLLLPRALRQAQHTKLEPQLRPAQLPLLQAKLQLDPHPHGYRWVALPTLHTLEFFLH